MTAAMVAVSAVLLACGLTCMATKRNAIGVLIGVELVLNASNVNFVAFSRLSAARHGVGAIDGHATALFVIVLAAAEAAVALAIALAFYNAHQTVDVDAGDSLKG